jgi:hypothetical protein
MEAEATIHVTDPERLVADWKSGAFNSDVVISKADGNPFVSSPGGLVTITGERDEVMSFLVDDHGIDPSEAESYIMTRSWSHREQDSNNEERFDEVKTTMKLTQKQLRSLVESIAGGQRNVADDEEVINAVQALVNVVVRIKVAQNTMTTFERNDMVKDLTTEILDLIDRKTSYPKM